LFRIKREVIIEKQRARLELELNYIMSGQKIVEGIKEKERENAVNRNNKRASTEWKRRSKGSLSLEKSRKQIKK
jgi:hypothetical protein